MYLKHCDNSSLDFQALVTKLDAELAIRDGEDHAFYHQFNGCLLYTSPSPRDVEESRMPSSA